MPEPSKNLILQILNRGRVPLAGLFSRRRRGRLVRHYFLISVVLISGGLISSGLLEIYFRYQENYENLNRLQQEVAAAAAFKVRQFVRQIEAAMQTATKSAEIARKGLSKEFQSELTRILLVTPPIEEVAALDLTGRIHLQASRFRAILSDDKAELPPQAAFEAAKKGNSFFGPVYFARGSEPYNVITVPIGRFAGDLIGILSAKVNLKYIWEVIQDIKVGKAGYAYIVTRSGDLVAHPDLSLVLRRQNLAHLYQVRTAFEPGLQTEKRQSVVSENLQGGEVFASFARIPELDWAVLIEHPLNEAYDPLYASVLRTSSLLLVGLGMALMASIFVARRVVRPLELLRWGAQRIGAGDLDHQLEIKTGDELEVLADEFNRMAAALKQSHDSLEAKVHERTQELRSANERLRDVDRLKSGFLSNVSHELRTPLTAIGGIAENLLDEMAGPLNEKQARYIKGIKESGDRLARLIDDLLDLSAIEANRIRLTPTSFPVDDLVYKVGAMLKPIAEAKSVALEVPARNGHFVPQADCDRITQVLTNLVINAIKFTPFGGKVALTLGPLNEGHWLQVNVTDNGPGIAAPEREKIFDEFYQISQADREKTVGVGLGLAICKRLVEMHGGTIWLDSAIGQGSSFHFTVPAAPVTPTEPAAS
ncbi:MAG TPA: ATP-binding protein [Candidatus Binatia bacterium]|nr:ATP-binding protein [Candidatus Binatia bacterium]